MDKLKNALNKANEKVSDAVGVGSSSRPHHSEHFPADVNESLDRLKPQLEFVKTLKKDVEATARKVKELATACSNLSRVDVPGNPTTTASLGRLKSAAQTMTQLEKLGQEWEDLVKVLDLLSKDNHSHCFQQSDKLAKQAKHVESLRKKNDASALQQEKKLEEDIELLRTTLAEAEVKFEDVMQRVSKLWVELAGDHMGRVAEAVKNSGGE